MNDYEKALCTLSCLSEFGLLNVDIRNELKLCLAFIKKQQAKINSLELTLQPEVVHTEDNKYKYE